MLEKIKGDYAFTCDSCNDYLETDQADFNVAINVGKREGWKAIKAGTDWQHKCPTCQRK